MNLKKIICCGLALLSGVLMSGSSVNIGTSTQIYSSENLVEFLHFKTLVNKLKQTYLQNYFEHLKIERKPKNTEITVSFLGDCLMATVLGNSPVGSFNETADIQPTTYFFEKAMPIIAKDDFTIANCENVFTDLPLTEVEKGYSPAFWFRSKMKNAKIFSDNSIDAVTLANNHTFDYGEKGLTDTKTALEKAGVLWGNEDKTVILEKNGVKIAVVSVMFSQWATNSKTINQLNELEKTTDIQVVVFHGGEEKVHTAEEWKKKASHDFIDNGADLVIGGHPHVLQPFEEYKGKHIIYSLGNFCYGGASYPENRTIIYQETFTLNAEKMLISSAEKIIPFYVYTGGKNNYQPAPIEDEVVKKQVLDFLYSRVSEFVIEK